MLEHDRCPHNLAHPQELRRMSTTQIVGLSATLTMDHFLCHLYPTKMWSERTSIKDAARQWDFRTTKCVPARNLLCIS